MHSLIRNHPFVDGNKRTAVIAVATFYALNGLDTVADDTALLALALEVGEGIQDVPEIAKRLEHMVRPLELPGE
jgi:death-on-curing protein